MSKKVKITLTRIAGTNLVRAQVENPDGAVVDCRLLQSIEAGDADDNVHWQTPEDQVKAATQEFTLEPPSENRDYEAKIDVSV